MFGGTVAAVFTGTGAAAQLPAARLAGSSEPADPIAFVNVTVIPMDTERVLPGHAVVVTDGRITTMGPMTKVKIPREATRVDGQGKYLIPGLADMHVHLLWTGVGNPSTVEHNVERKLRSFLAQGVTTIRNMDYQNRDAGEVVLAMRDRALAGEILSPRIYTAGPWMTKNDYSGHTVFEAKPDTFWRIAPGQVADRIAAYKAAGYDFIKPYYESSEIFDSVVAAARRVGIPVAGHVPFAASLQQALAARVQSIEHLTGYLDHAKLWTSTDRLEVLGHLRDDSQFTALAAATRQAGTWNCPTLIAVEDIIRIVPGAKPEDYPYVPAMRRFVKALQDAGAGLLLGTDVREMGSLEVVEELMAFTKAGLTPYQALVTGTRNVAAYFGTLDSTGTIAPGKRADLVLLNGNPFQDVQHVARPVGTMIGGRWLLRDSQDQHRTTKPQSAP